MAPIAIILGEQGVPPNQPRVAARATGQRGIEDGVPQRCCACKFSTAAVGALRGIWLFCDHPEVKPRRAAPLGETEGIR